MSPNSNRASDHIERFEAAALPNSRGVLRTAFLTVAPELRDWESGQRYPFVSGISADGCPLEVSISLSHKSVSAARFIVQPFRFDRDCVGIFKHRWAALKSSLNFRCDGEPIDGVLQTLEQHEVDDRRSCVCWLGAENTIEERLSAKIYINPFGFSDLSPGEVIAIALRRFDRSPSANNALKELLSELPEMTLSLIGFNVDPNGSSVCKLYFVVGVRSVDDLTTFLCASGVANSRHIAQLFFRSSEGHIEQNVLQVHVAVTISDPPAAKTSIYLQPSRCTPSDSFARLSEAGRMFGLGESVLEHALKIAQTDEGSGESRLNFIGFGATKADLYFRAL